MNNKGIVMEITDKSIVVMRPDGKFERVSRKKRNCEIGEEITYAEPGINWRSPSVAGRSAIAAAVVFCLVLFASFNGKLGAPEVIAYVSMDINPSIEMGIDIKENVLELRGINDDGNELIQNINYKGEKLEDVASRLLDKAEQKSLAKGEAEIVIASTVVQENDKVTDTQLAAKLREQVTKHIEKTHPAEASSYQVAAFAAPQEVRQAAVQNGVSMGKYTVYLNAKNSGTEVTLDELKKESVLQISKEKPELAKVISRESIPSKAEIKKLVEEEKSGQLDKKLEEKLKEKKDNNGKGSSTTGSQSGKNGQSGQNNSQNNSQNGKNGQSNQTNQNGQQNGKTDPKKPGTTNGSSVPGKSTDKKDNEKDDKSDDKKDERKDNKSTPANSRPGTTNPSNPQTKPGATGPGAVRPGDKQDDRKDDADRKAQDKKKEEDLKREEDKKNEEQRRKEEADRRLEEQKKKAEEQKKEQDKKEQEKKAEEQKKEQDKKDQDKKEQDKKDERKSDDSKKNDGKNDDKTKDGGR